MDTFSGMPISRKQCKCHGGYRASHKWEYYKNSTVYI